MRFRDYKNYPETILDASYFRDEFDDLPDGAFFALAQEENLFDELIEMAEWEWENENTYKDTKE